jgi:hypothetical protein
VQPRCTVSRSDSSSFAFGGWALAVPTITVIIKAIISVSRASRVNIQPLNEQFDGQLTTIDTNIV